MPLIINSFPTVSQKHTAYHVQRECMDGILKRFHNIIILSHKTKHNQQILYIKIWVLRMYICNLSPVICCIMLLDSYEMKCMNALLLSLSLSVSLALALMIMFMFFCIFLYCRMYNYMYLCTNRAKT